MDLLGKTAIVTGASRGIGRATALGLGARGASVVVSCNTRIDLAREVVRDIESSGGRAVAWMGDLSSEQSVMDLFDEAESKFGGIHIVVANACRQVPGRLADTSGEEFETNLVGELRISFFTMREAARRVSDGGRVIAISSLTTRLMLPGLSTYLGVKGAVEQLVRVLSRELGERQITVNAVSPGATETDAFQQDMRELAVSLSALGRVGLPEEVAEVVVFLAGNEGRWITGQNIGATGGAA